jgi:MoaA/NifB/PqqE/SkfB family radical SAM enzyme
MEAQQQHVDHGRPEVIRRTRGTCPICIEMVDAQVVEDQGLIYLEKMCPAHGLNRMVLSRNPAYYRELMRYYFDLLPDSIPQRDFILRLTARCNMKCPICLASADQYAEQDMSLQQYKDFLRGRPRTKLDLMGAEPTLHEDLVEMIRFSTEQGHISALHTNGIVIQDPEVLQRLVDAGLDEVHLQFDGFRDDDDMVLRGQPMSRVRHKVLKSLEQFGVATDLVVTVMKGLNEDQMEACLDYAARHSFVKEVFYLGCRPLGRASTDYMDQCLAPDETIDLIEQATAGRINRDDFRVFNKLYFALLAIFAVRKCFYIHHYMVLRGRHGYEPLSEHMDLAYLEPKLDRFRDMFVGGSRRRAAAYLLSHCGIAITRKRGFPLLLDGLMLNVLLALGFDLSRIRRKLILIGAISACDPWMYDEQIAANCGKGEISNDQGVHEAGAWANVSRERYHLRVNAAGLGAMTSGNHGSGDNQG